MNLIHPSVELLWHTPKPLQAVELAGRTCYKSEDKINENTAEVFLKNLISQGHDAMIEFASATVRVICDRGVSHEIVRHRLASYAQESTRYCNYKKVLTFIIPPWFNFTEGWYSFKDRQPVDCDMSNKALWECQMLWCEATYIHLIKNGQSPQQARSVLPNSLKTEIVMHMNMREWRHFFSLRLSKKAHPQMQQTAKQILQAMWDTEVQPFIAGWEEFNDSNNN